MIDIEKEREVFEEVFPCSTGTVLNKYGHYESQINPQDAMYQKVSWGVWMTCAKLKQAEIDDLKAQLKAVHESRADLVEYCRVVEAQENKG